ncbi:MAG: hypothetical protein WBA16_09440, partial [Nonlabens sp.]
MSHFIHSCLLALLLYGVYAVWLSRETFFQFNRFYLIFIPVISICLPLVHFDFLDFTDPAVFDMV